MLAIMRCRRGGRLMCSRDRSRARELELSRSRRVREWGKEGVQVKVILGLEGQVKNFTFYIHQFLTREMDPLSL